MSRHHRDNAAMREVSKYWLRDSVAERIASYNVPAAVKRFVCELAPEADLRATRIPGLEDGSPSHGALLVEHVFAPGYELVEPFLRGVPVGPLSGVQVYSTDAFDRYQGKAHAPGGCQHAERLGRYDDLLTFEEWVPLVAAYSELGWSNPLCSKCGGFSMRKLTVEQGAYLARAFELGDLAHLVGWHERQQRAGADRSAPGRDDLAIRREELSDLRRRLDATATEPAARDYVSELGGRIEVLQRRLAMRLGDG